MDYALAALARRRSLVLLLGSRLHFVLAAVFVVAAATSSSAQDCRITEPNRLGQSELTNHSVDPIGVFLTGPVIFRPGGPGLVLPDGALQMKFGWWRGVTGRLRITGRRLDDQAPLLRASIPNGYGESGFQATGLIFPTPGCWEITGHLGEARLTFVTEVIKIGEGPRSSVRR